MTDFISTIHQLAIRDIIKGTAEKYDIHLPTELVKKIVENLTPYFHEIEKNAYKSGQHSMSKE